MNKLEYYYKNREKILTRKKSDYHKSKSLTQQEKILKIRMKYNPESFNI